MKAPIMTHLHELKSRLLWTSGLFFVFFITGIIAAPIMQQVLLLPLIDAWDAGTIIYTRMTDGLYIDLSLAALFAIFATIPVFFYHLWRFISPGLRPNEKQLILPIMMASPVLFLMGAAFAYFILLPLAFEFFIRLNYTSAMYSVLLPHARDYLTFVISILKAFGIAFQLPLVLIVLNRTGILARDTVIKYRRYAIVGIFVLAAVLTPPDVLSQIILALPLIILFELSILFMKKS